MAGKVRDIGGKTRTEGLSGTRKGINQIDSNAAEGHFIEPGTSIGNSGGTDLHIETAGSTGPRILLVQGTGVAGRAWLPQVEALKDSFQLAWFDNRGIGLSPGEPTTLEAMAEDTQAVFAALGWESAHVAGHSLGGVVALAFAAKWPDRIRSLALICSFLHGSAAGPTDPRKLWLQLRSAIGTAEMRRRAFYEMVTAANQPCTPENIDQLERAFGRRLNELPKATMKQVRLLMRANLESAAHQWTGPSTVIAGTDDRMAPASESYKLAEALSCPYHELPGGHALPIQNAASLNELLATWWSTTEENA